MGIKIASNFDIETTLPLDSRFVKNDIAARDAIPAYTRFDGLLTYVKSDDAIYQLRNGIANSDWTKAAIDKWTELTDTPNAHVAQAIPYTSGDATALETGATHLTYDSTAKTLTVADHIDLIVDDSELNTATIETDLSTLNVIADSKVDMKINANFAQRWESNRIQIYQDTTMAANKFLRVHGLRDWSSNSGTAGQVMTADGAGKALWGTGASGGGYWDRDAGNGGISPSTLTDKVGINEANPNNELQVVGSVSIGDSDASAVTGIPLYVKQNANHAVAIKCENDSTEQFAYAAIVASAAVASFALLVYNPNFGGIYSDVVRFSANNASSLWIESADGSIKFIVDSTNAMFIERNGKVGINETNPQDTLEVNGTVLVKDALKFTQDDGNENIDSLNDGYLDYSATTQHRFHSELLVDNRIAFTQADGNENIGSYSDGYLDYAAGTQHRFTGNSGIKLTAHQAAITNIDIINNNASGGCQVELSGTGSSAYFLNDTVNNTTELAFANNELHIRDRGTTPYVKIAASTHDYILDTSGVGATNLILGSDGQQVLTINGQTTSFPDVYTIIYTDYSSSTTVTGFSGTPTKKVKYKLIGKQLYCFFDISGTSDGTLGHRFWFTLPWNPAEGSVHIGTCTARDAGADVNEGGSVSGYASGGTIRITKYQGYSKVGASGDNWTNSGTKSARGSFTYEIA